MTYNEDEQLENLKRFWDDYGTAILLAVALVFAGMAGWKLWQKNRADQIDIASHAYQAMGESLQKLQGDANAPAYKKANTELQKNAQKLKTDYPGSAFAQFSSLLVAKHDVDTNDLKAAAKQLQATLDQKPEEGLRIITTVRLARVKAASGDVQGGLKLLENEKNPYFTPLLAETRGDLDMALNKLDAARVEYQAADAALAKRGDAFSPMLEAKLGNLGVSPLPRKTDKDDKAAAQ